MRGRGTEVIHTPWLYEGTVLMTYVQTLLRRCQVHRQGLVSARLVGILHLLLPSVSCLYSCLYMMTKAIPVPFVSCVFDDIADMMSYCLKELFRVRYMPHLQLNSSMMNASHLLYSFTFHQVLSTSSKDISIRCLELKYVLTYHSNNCDFLIQYLGR